MTNPPEPPTIPLPAAAAAKASWRRISPLARDIVVVLVIKLLVLYGLWYAFFRMPAAPGMSMDPALVEHKLFAPVPPVEPPHER